MRLTKQKLFRAVELAILESGWSFLHIPAPSRHPALYQVYRGRQNHRVRIYVWNLTPGGNNRPRDEWRIQATGIRKFDRETDGKTLILGWQDEWSVVAGFDIARHEGPVGNSPSIQLREDALHKAVVDGFAPHNKGNNELALAFRPEFLASYIDNLESLHECGQVPAEIAMLEQIVDVGEEQVEEVVAPPRRHAVVTTKRVLRDSYFRNRVLTAYRDRCAMCNVQLRLLEGAHILPANHPESTDETNNGVALCVLHHRAYDRAFVTFDPEFRIHVNKKTTAELEKSRLTDGLQEFRAALRPILVLPADSRDRPDGDLVNHANALRGWPPPISRI